MRQSWDTLLFAHYQLPAASLRPLVPAGLHLEEEGGMAWVGVVPFHMSGVMLRGLPDLPGLSAFPELNVRLYVRHDGRPGVWFLSLDATNPVAVWTARRFVHLPYRRARMTLQRLPGEPERHDYRSAVASGPARSRFHARYGPTGPAYQAAPGTVEATLTERYCLYAAAPDGRLYRTEVHHLPWPLQPATAEVDAAELLSGHGLTVTGPPPLLHFARRVDVLTWAPERVTGE